MKPRIAAAAGAYDIPFAEYLALDAWGSSALKAMRRGPPARVLVEHEDTAATILGRAVHCALLTPELFAAQYAIKPEGMTFSSNLGKAWRDHPDRAGRELLSHDVGATVERIVEALKAKVLVRDSLAAATARELSLVWECPSTGEMCKARPDWIEGGYIHDLKVSRHASGNALAYRAHVDGWMHQSSHYRAGAIELGMPIKGGRLVVVEPTEPHFVYTLEIKPDALDLLELENIETRKRLRECRVSGVWPGPDDVWTKIEPPARAETLEGTALDGDDEEAESAEEQSNG